MDIADAKEGVTVAIAVKNNLPLQLNLVKLSHQVSNQAQVKVPHQLRHVIYLITH